MGEIRYEDKRFWYIDEKKKQVLIDLRRCIDNISRVPVIDDGTVWVSMMQIINRLQEIHGAMDADAENTQFDYVLLDFLLARCCMRSALPLHAVEIGGMDGIWSFHMAFMMGQYHPSSLLCSVCNGIGNESGNQWLDKISLVGEPPRLSMLAADYEDTMLQTDGFDIAAVNGRGVFEHPYPVIKEAERLVKKGGVILCYAKNQPALSEAFQQRFPDCECFETGRNTSILVVEYQGSSGEEFPEASCKEAAEAYLAEAGKLLSGKAEKEQLRACWKQLDHYIDTAIQEQQIDLKVRLIQCQEDVLDAMYPADEG